MTRSEQIELNSDITHSILELFQELGFFKDELLRETNIQNLANGEETYTNEAQDLFDAIYDIIDAKLQNKITALSLNRISSIIKEALNNE